MASQAKMLVLSCLITSSLLLTSGQAQTCMSSSEQPVVNSLDPPSGTTGEDPSLSTRYTITGERLDNVMEIFAEFRTQFGPGRIDVVESSIDQQPTSISFNFVLTSGIPSDGIQASLMVVPINTDCSTLTIPISLHDTARVSLDVSTVAQPGTTILATLGTCLPSSCGDNSTTYSAVVGGIVLDLIEAVSSSLIARFPDFDNFRSPSDFVIRTDYQMFTLPRSNQFDLFLPTTIVTVTPSQGQRGTRITITGTQLLGYGESVSISEVMIGGMAAEIIDATQERITLRASTAPPGLASISINTTQILGSANTVYDGPYNYFEDIWTQLEDGVISDIVPPAVQVGGSVTLCGTRLLGGGTSIAEVILAGISSTNFLMTPITATASLPGDECITTDVPDTSGMFNISGLVDIVADTGALVQSTMSFAFAEIQEVSPSRGQPGTIVAIRGAALLSGYSPSDVTTVNVTLSGVEANLMSISETEIIVRALEPQNGTNDTVFGQLGAVDVTVTGPGPLSSLSFVVTSDNQSWTYETPGEIDNVEPAFGQFGTLLTITGTNLLSYGTALLRVTVGGLDASLVEATNNVVRIRAPDGAVGNVSIVLFADNGAEIEGSGLFEFLERGTIDQVLPDMGQYGTFVVINGTNLFGHGDNITSVNFGDVPATIDFNQSNSSVINVRIQPNTAITQDTLVSVSITSDTSAVVESNSSWTYLVQGIVTDIQPPTGQEGTRVTLTGINLLGGGDTAVRVIIDNVEGRVVSESVSDSRIEVIMDNIDSRMEAGFPGQAFIVADTGAIVMGGSYTHQSSGIINSFSPMTGRDGTRVTISGQNLLGFGDSVTMVTVAGNPATIRSFSNTEVTIQVGPGAEVDEGPIQLIINTGAVITSSINFTYTPPGNITNVSPDEGAEGLGVLIEGSELYPSNAQLTSVTVGGIPVSRIVTATTTEISVILGSAPTTNPMMAEIIITASDESFVGGSFFRFIDLVISLTDQTSGREGTLLAILLPASPDFDVSVGLRATVDDEEAPIESTSAGMLTVRVPRAKRVGTYAVDVAVENPQRLVARLTNGFTYLPEGAIYSVTPNEGQRGTRVILEGENFLGGGSEISSAMIAGVPAAVLFDSDQRVEAQLMENPGASDPSNRDILLTADTGAITLRLDAFTIAQPGVVRMVSPASGQAGTLVTITGTDLIQGEETIDRVTLAGVQATLLENASDTSITVQASSSFPSTPSGPVEILLTTGAQITSEQTFEYIQEGQIDRLTPNRGPEGTRVLIEGDNLLGGGNSVETVLLGGVEAVVETFTNDSVTVIAQAAEPGSGDVEIISDTGARVFRPTFWTYTQLGSITSIDPPVGQQGIEVTLSGIELLGSGNSVVECRLAGIVGTLVTIQSRSSVVCRAGFFPNLISQPENGTGPAEIVSNHGVVVRSEENVTFTYYVAQIDTVTPSSGNNGTIVRISGVNLVGFPGEGSTVASVQFGGVEATVLSNTGNDITVRAGLSMNGTQNDVVRVTSSDGSFVELDNAWSFSPLKQIFSVSPMIAFPGDTVNITGLGFISAPGVTIEVIVGQTRSAEARIIGDDSIEFVAGVHQSTDNAGEPLPVQIVYSTGEIVFEPTVTFTYNETRGIINSVTPSAGAENTLVKITGLNLIGNENQTVTQVYLAGVAARIQDNATDSEIVVIAGAGPNEGSFGTVVIETSDGLQFGLAGNAWRYYPRLSNTVVSPTRGQNGTIVRINLLSVDPLPMIENVTLAGFPALDFSVSAGGVVSATVETPDNITTGDVVISFTDSTELTIMNAWTYLESVEVTSYDMQGYFSSLITILGQNFQASGLSRVSSVFLASLDTQIVSQSDTTLQVRITEFRDSNSQSFEGPIVIISDQGATFTSSDNFTYVQVRVDSVDPQQGQRGTRVNITGIGLLLGGTSISAISLGNVSANIINATDEEILVSAAEFPFQTNISDIVYSVDSEAELTIPDSWRYITPGEITSVSPEEGGMGTIVTIMGMSLFGGGTGAEAVLLNNVPAQSILTNFDSLIQVVAGGSATGLSPGSVQIISDTGAVTESTANVAYRYLTPGMISAATPQNGQNGTRVMIDGSFLHNGEGIDRVLLAGVEATIESTTEDSLQAGLPSSFVVRAGRPSAPHSFSGPVTIISHFNTMSISDFNFTYLSEGVLFSVSPSQGQTGTMVTIEGENLLGGGTTIVRSYLSGVLADVMGTPTNEGVQLRANPSQEAILGDIVLVSDSGAYVRRVDGWRYVEEGSVLDILPSEGQRGTRVEITGERLLSGGDRVVRAFLDDVELEVMGSSAGSVMARVGEPMSPFSVNASNITLISNFGGTLIQSIDWLFLNQSMIENITPPSGFGLTTVTINGTNLLGGGTVIDSAVMDTIPATVDSSSDTQVVLTAGFNFNGQERTGDVILTSDTGAITVLEDGWTYDRECPAGLYGNRDNCLPCHEECSTCDGPNSTDCFTCMNFINELENTTRYVECVPVCPSVSTLEMVCRDECGPGTFPRYNAIENVTFCHPCHPQCDPNLRCTGSDATQCQGCLNVFNTLNQTCTDECPQGTYTDELNRCEPCDLQCTTEGGCFGPNSTDCIECENVYVTVLDMNSVTRDSCLQKCPSLYFQETGSDLCTPCDSQCLEECSGPSSLECRKCRGPFFVLPNGDINCVATCNSDPLRKIYYQDSNGTCLNCSSRCSLSGGCTGPTAFDCNGCRKLFDSSTNASLPTLDGECVNACPNENSTYSFYADNTTNQCEPCDRACSDGCTGPLPTDCIQVANPLAAGGGAIAIFIIILIIFVIVVIALVVHIIYQRKHFKYKVTDEEDGLVLKSREVGRMEETNLTSSDTASPTHGITNAGFESDSTKEAPQADVPAVAALQKSDGVTGSQDLYLDMAPAPLEEPRYSTPTPKSLRKKEEAAAPPVPAPYKKSEESSKPPPPRPPSPDPQDGDLYTDMEASIQEVRVNPIAGVEPEEEYSEMSPGPIVHHGMEEVYDDAESMQPVSSPTKTPSPPPKSEETAPLLEDMYEDADTAVAQANEYKRISRAEMNGHPRPISGVPEKVPDLPNRPIPKKRSSDPLPQTPLQKSLSSTPLISPTSSAAMDEIYEETGLGPLEESLYEELPTGILGELPPRGQPAEISARGMPAEPLVNQLPLPPKPKK